MKIIVGTKFKAPIPKKGISGQRRKNRTCACVHGRYLLY